MPDRQGRKGRSEDMLPKDRVRWAKGIWAEREACAKTDAGIWMLREAAKTLGGLTPYEYICKIWTSEPDRFILDPIHQIPGLNT